MNDENHSNNEKLVQAYNQMMIRVSEALADATKKAEPILAKTIDTAEDKAVELGELSREEARKIAEYLRRDLQDVGEFLTSTEAEEFSDWLRFDIQQIESRLFDMFLSVADQAKLDMLDFEEQLAEACEYRTGEITGPGTLVCEACGEVLHFHKAGHIPPCPKCHATAFMRVSDKTD